MAQANSGEKLITIDGEKYFVRTRVVYQDGLGTQGTLSTTAPLRYVVQYRPYRSIGNIDPTWTNLGERDVNNKNNWIFTPEAGTAFRVELAKAGNNSLTHSLDDATTNALSESANVTKQQANQILQVAPNVSPTVVDTDQTVPTSSDGGPKDEDKPIDYIEATSGLKQINDVNVPKFEDLRYPIGSDINGQDYIQFTVFEYLSQTQGENKFVFESPGYKKEDAKGRIYLPIQPTITDTNTVSWGEDKFGILEMMGANLSLGAMNGDSAKQLSEKFAETVTSSGSTLDPKIVSAVQTYLSKMAVGSNNNLLSRLTGAVTNPNLTLLFNSPDLRNFNFNFKLTPRTQSEGTIVRKIIRVFKQYMAVQRSSGNLFLEAPCIFKIRYIRGKDRFNKEDDLDHPALNRIKTCALRNFSVNYTPAGSYMTYNDQAGTMSSYDLTMSFTELEPVYSDDYYSDKDGYKIPVDQIGY